ncbi:MAG TPA: SGNH/GDSL hydrolase family protein [Pseudolysinimonas sp.]|nr:SGNH/GDSL hydrolase family protein [Pseudolysinimonas sp.]
MLQISLDDTRVRVSGLARLERDGDGWWTPWRLPEEVLDYVGNNEFARAPRSPTGARIALRTDASVMTFSIDCEVGDACPLDLMVDDQLVERCPIAQCRATFTWSLPFGEHVVELWLPQFGAMRLGQITLSDAATLSLPPAATAQWIAHGSSITQCSEASGPSEAWPTLVSRAHDWELTNLGFGAQCHLDQTVARYIRDHPPVDLIFVCAGINIYGQASLTARSLPSALSGFIHTVRDGHPTTPIVLMSPILAPEREDTPNAVGLTLRDVRDIVSDMGETLVRHNDENLTIIDGLTVFGAEDAHLLGDGLHPTTRGYRLMAERLGPKLALAIEM